MRDSTLEYRRSEIALDTIERLLRCLPLAECQCAKVAVDDIQQGLGPGKSQGHMANIKVLHVVAALQVLMHISLAFTTAQP